MYSEQHLHSLFTPDEIGLATTQLAALVDNVITTKRIWDHLISTLKLDATAFIKLTFEETIQIVEKSEILYSEDPEFKYEDLASLCDKPEKYLRNLSHLDLAQLLTMLAIRKGKDFKAKLLSFLKDIEKSELR